MHWSTDMFHDKSTFPDLPMEVAYIEDFKNITLFIPRSMETKQDLHGAKLPN